MQLASKLVLYSEQPWKRFKLTHNQLTAGEGGHTVLIPSRKGIPPRKEKRETEGELQRERR